MEKARIKVHELRNKNKAELQNQLKDLKAELALLRVAKVTGGAPNKLSKMCLTICLNGGRLQKGGEAFDSAGLDGDFAEAEGRSEGSLQDKEVFAARSASQEDQGHQEASHQAPDANLVISVLGTRFGANSFVFKGVLEDRKREEERDILSKEKVCN
ncbi:hypothetical protein TIFTF001_000534 [Ficus carica]|uniref:Uncharacterized protein n=1 Tax=Ficus carica TaxID=3494 RepID=A0AA87YXQ8_FICCA|nr:hypothetical protein TIFTF001_000534 [Ficus carica]